MIIYVGTRISLKNGAKVDVNVDVLNIHVVV